MKLRFTAFLLLIVSFIYAQVTNEGKPASWKIKELGEIAPHVMPKFDLEKLQQEDLANAGRKDIPWRFGYEFIVDHNLANSGSWFALPNGDRIWRIRYVSNDAKTMNFLFSDFYMPAGAKVYLYNNERTELLGAYDAAQNNELRVLGTWLVKGDDIWIEYYEPKEVAGQGKLEVFKVIHGYRSADDMAKSTNDIGESGDCNYDVDCFMDDIDDMKDINKKAVGLIIVNGNSHCTGALINNTNNDGTPYFLTANHCYTDSDPAEWAFRFSWISPNPVCASATNSTDTDDYYQTLSGAELRARREESDFCLVEITADVPDSWDLIWAGWNRSETPAESTFGIHHPAGDIMKACRDFDSPEVDNTGGQFMWEIQDWDLGVTEGGSSGSPLFDNNGRIIGQLYGGFAACNGLTDNGDSDYYGRLGISWNAGSSSASRLKEWLDPAGTNAVTLDYFPSQEIYALNARIGLEDVGQEGCGTEINPVIRITNKGTEDITAAVIQYTFNWNAPATYEWTGNLAQDESTTIVLPSMEGYSGNNTFTATITTINGVADEYPADNTSTESFDIKLYEIANVTFDLHTDSFGGETTWELVDADGDEIYSGGPYGEGAQEDYTYTFELDAEGCYTFTIYDQMGDGICCSWGTGSYSLLLENGTIIAEGGAFEDSESITFGLVEELSVNENLLQDAIKIYPNPSKGLFAIQTANVVGYQLYNVLGQVIRRGKFNAGNGSLDITNTASGIYILSVTDAVTGRNANFRLIKE
ncbi:MAG TPA: T9SS type A sorting domain-containing protein [Flavobacterium sp.]|nr:T9SS type A sorting domain-containing protein [Flavobacterium sp.]